MDPNQATDLATSLDTPVFTVLLGSTEEDDSKVDSRDADSKQDHGVNPDLLKEIASKTGGQFFHASTDDELEKSFGGIRDSLELTQFEVLGNRPDKPLFGRLAIWVLLGLLLELCCRATRWRRFR